MVMQDILRDIEDHDIGAAVSHFLNCFFGNYQTAGGKATANSLHAKNQKKVLVYNQSLLFIVSCLFSLNYYISVLWRRL